MCLLGGDQPVAGRECALGHRLVEDAESAQPAASYRASSLELRCDATTAVVELGGARLRGSPSAQRRGSGVEHLGTPERATPGVTQDQPVAVAQR